jgi:23S rRNA (guanine2535-N1)-methyltransferase
VTYRFTTRTDHTDLAGGAVLHSAPGFPGFPVRLASETFQRALALRPTDSPVTVWDPCCGSGYLLTVLALLHRDRIRAVIASDLDPDALTLAHQNLTLLTAAGLDARAQQLTERAQRFDKPSYHHTANTARRLARTLDRDGGDVPHTTLHADALDPTAMTALTTHHHPDLVITDVPYGEHTTWSGPHHTGGIEALLAALAQAVPDDTVVAITTRGRRVPLTVRPNDSFRIGTRAVALLTGSRLRPP